MPWIPPTRVTSSLSPIVQGCDIDWWVAQFQDIMIHVYGLQRDCPTMTGWWFIQASLYQFYLGCWFSIPWVYRRGVSLFKKIPTGWWTPESLQNRLDCPMFFVWIRSNPSIIYVCCDNPIPKHVQEQLPWHTRTALSQIIPNQWFLQSLSFRQAEWEETCWQWLHLAYEIREPRQQPQPLDRAFWYTSTRVSPF